MPTFDTPEPISVTLDLGAGSVSFSPSDRTDTVVTVRPTDESDESDVQASEDVRVEYSGGSLLVKGPRPRALDFSRKSRSVDVTIELPAGSDVHGDLAMGDVVGSGRLGACRLKTGMGHVHLDRTGPLRVSTGAGNISVNQVVGHAEVTTGSGKLRVGDLDGSAVLKNSNGTCEVGRTTGHLRVATANGDITVGHTAADDVVAKTSNGSIRVDDATRGQLVLETALGDLEVGIHESTAAWLDVRTRYGRVRQDLEDTDDAPGQSDETVEVRGRTSFGDITIRRA
jgi:DUF4097 and DUF4098 domain-containing protein YvlB